MSIPALKTACAISWGELVYDTEVPLQTKDNLKIAFEAVDKLLTKYNIIINHPITVVVAANNAESYIQALMSHGKMSRTQAEDKIKSVNLGLSNSREPLIIIRYYPYRQQTGQGTSRQIHPPEEGFHTLPHEVFHQVQNQYGRRRMNWMVEGPAELFKFIAIEAAGIRGVAHSVQRYEQEIRKNGKIPDTRQLASYDYKDWISLGYHKYPVYQMAAVMTYRLLGDNGFEKLLSYYQLLHDGVDRDQAFNNVFGIQLTDFLADMNDYFNKLCSSYP
nr:hypothetical protein [uncultured bacterium]